MKASNHSKFHQLIQRSADGQLNPSQQQTLDAHLAGCAECRLYAEELRALETQLASVSVTRRVPPAARQAFLIINIQKRYRRYQMNKQMLSFAGTLAALAVVAALVLLFGHIVPRQTAPAVALSATIASEKPAITPTAESISATAITPAWLPAGYTYLTSKTLDRTQSSCLYYLGPGDDPLYPSLVIVQTTNGLLRLQQLRDPLYSGLGIDNMQIPVITETLPIGGATGVQSLFMESGMDPSQLCGGERDPMDRALMWQSDHTSFVLFTRIASWTGGGFLTRLEMQRVAESMTGVATIAPDTVDPERMTDLPTAKEIAGFNFKNPADVPGLIGRRSYDYAPFNFISFEQSGSVRRVALIYTDKLQIRITAGTANTLETYAALAPDHYEHLLVDGHPALFSPGICWDEKGQPFTANCGSPQTLTWFENDMEYQVEGFMEKAQLIEIANSLRYADLTIAAAERLAGFQIYQPASLPAGYGFQYAEYEDSRQAIFLNYADQSDADPSGLLKSFTIMAAASVTETLDTLYNAHPEIYERLTVRGQPALYFQGCWANGVYDRGCAGSQSLTWFEKGLEYSIYGVFTNAMFKATLSGIAESLVIVQQSKAGDLAAYEAQVGHPIKTLASLPADYVFSQVEVDQPTNSVCVKYSYTANDSPGPELWLAQGPLANTPGLAALLGDEHPQQTPVDVGGAEQAYALSGLQRNGEWACTQSQTDSPPPLRLTWQAGGQQYDLYAMPGKCMLEEGLSDLDLLHLAEGITGVADHAADELDPQCSRDITAIEDLAGFDARFPQWISPGMQLYGLSYGGEPGKQIRLYYMQLPGSNHTGLVIQELPVNAGLGNDLASQTRDLPAEGYQSFTIGGAPAVLILGTLTTDDQGNQVWYQAPGFAPSLWFESDGLLIGISGPWLAEASDPQAKLTALAESILYANISLDEAKSLAGFNILDPASWRSYLTSVSYDPLLHMVNINYQYLGASLSQQPAPEGVDCELCGFVVGDNKALDSGYPRQIVSASATIETVQIGDVTGEYVEGVWSGAYNNGVWAWDSSGSKRLRWRVNGVAYELDGISLSKEEMIAIAESMR
jgi:hypothetical protein